MLVVPAEDTFDASAEDGQIDAEMDTVEPSGESRPPEKFKHWKRISNLRPVHVAAESNNASVGNRTEDAEGQFNHRKRRSMLRLKMTISISRWLRLSYPQEDAGPETEA
ncbi:hypothetical protein AnigIFM59636_004239 [Aspergillus niger]|nr:hypothetical protein AnigIFM59636_004239 [Aspergillus niger]